MAAFLRRLPRRNTAPAAATSTARPMPIQSQGPFPPPSLVGAGMEGRVPGGTAVGDAAASLNETGMKRSLPRSAAFVSSLRVVIAQATLRQSVLESMTGLSISWMSNEPPVP